MHKDGVAALNVPVWGMEAPRAERVQLGEHDFVFDLIGDADFPHTMVDVGAHYGGSLAPFAKADWRVFAFEPDPANRAHLLKAVKGAKNVIVSEDAVCDREGDTLPFYSSEESTGISGLTAFRETHREVARVQTTTLNAVLKQHGVSDLGFLKIDVEGLELSVLKGLDFGKVKPRVVLLEFEDAKTTPLGYDSHDLAGYLMSFGYTVYSSEWWPIERYGVRHSWRRFVRYPCDIPSVAWGNFIAFLDDPGEQAVSDAVLRTLNGAQLVRAEGPAINKADAPREPASRTPTAAKPASAPTSTPGGPTALQPQTERAVVLGNGPSLRGFDFSILAGVASIGMNAAYRYWDTIDWRPTHYCCLDDALIDTHHTEIHRLMTEGRIETAFLSGSYLKYHPEAVDDARFVFLDQFVKYWHETRGKALGLAFTDHPAFRSTDPSKLTTGAFAARYAAYCGYTHIGLLGVDLRYQEQPAAQPLEGHRLTLSETPASNPNYFFDDYQRAGDVFHEPNPAEHGGDLHLDAFRVLRNDLAGGHLDVEIVNLNLKSRLHADGVIPYRSVADFLGRPVLGAVVVPVSPDRKSVV